MKRLILEENSLIKTGILELRSTHSSLNIPRNGSQQFREEEILGDRKCRASRSDPFIKRKLLAG